MEITNNLRDIILKKRKELGLSLTDISKKSINKKSGKPSLSISTLSAIETGKLLGLKEETFNTLADILKIDTTGVLSDQRIIKIAFGLCCWASPIINAVVKEKNLSPEAGEEELDIPNLWLSCYADNKGEPIQLINYNQNPKPSDHILTANETLNLLQRGTIDIAFLPVMTAETAPGIIRIARCMNTGKGGVYLFIIGKKAPYQNTSALETEFVKKGKFNYEGLEEIKDILRATDNKEKCCFVFPKNSIAQIEIEQTLFDQTQYPKHEIEVSSVTNFENEIKKRISQFFSKENAIFFVYAGWDFHIDKLRKMFPKKDKFLGTIDGYNLVGREFDSYRFTKFGYPFAQMSYDCITLESKYDYLIKHPGLNKLLSILSENVKGLNQVKMKVNNSRYRQLNNLLCMGEGDKDEDLETLSAILDRINWEFLIYPEMLDKSLK